MKTIFARKKASPTILPKLSILFFYFFLSPPSFGQGPANDTIELPTEKVYLHLNRAFYTAGETVWFKAYLVDGSSHRPETLSKIVYVDLIDPVNKIVHSKTIKVEKGNGHGDFEIPRNVLKGEYTVQAYTNYMRNFDDSFFFRKKILINNGRSSPYYKTANTEDSSKSSKKRNLSENQKPDIQFFPEGGYMVNGFINHIALKAVDINGKGIAIDGHILDDFDRKVTNFSTSHLGFGRLHFIPKENERYRAILTKNGKEYYYDLPASLSTGTLMNLVETQNHYRVEIRSSLEKGIENLRVIGKQSKGLVLDAKIRLKNQKKSAVIEVSKNKLIHGIIQFTLFDDLNVPLTERLIFHETDNNYVPSFSFNDKEYGQRELVEIEVKLDRVTNATNTNLSMAVTDVSVTQPEIHTRDIKTYLLLSSELKGEIEKPGYYFYSNDPNRKKNLDLLMMTQGWRKYVINKTKGKSVSDMDFLPEKDISLSGRIENPYNRKLPFVSHVSLAYENNQEMGHARTKTDEFGQFFFKDLNFADSTSVVLESETYRLNPKTGQEKGRPNPGYIMLLDTLKSPKVTIQKARKSLRNTIDFETYLNGAENADGISYSFLANGKTIELEEVTVESKKPVKKTDNFDKKRELAIYSRPSYTIDFEELRDKPFLNALTALKGRVPGFQVSSGSAPTLRGSVSMTGDGTPLFLVNGVPVLNFESVLDISIMDIDFVDVLSAPRAAIYGSRAANGAIAVYTLDGGEVYDENDNYRRSEGIVKFTHPGYDYAREFYEPKYDIKRPEHSEFDHRTTLCWKPNIRLDKNGMTKVSFYTSDRTMSYKVVLEGLTSNGVPLRSETTFDVIEKNNP